MIPVERQSLITGCGALSPLGRGVDAFWRGLVEGRCAIGPIQGFDASDLDPARAAEVRGFNVDDLPPPFADRLDRIAAYGLVAVLEALEQARLDPFGGAGCADALIGVIMATTLGGMIAGEDYQRARAAGEEFDTRRLLRLPYYALASQLARALGVRGPVASPSIACASGTHAVGMAAELIALGHADAFVVGGAETLCRFVVGGFNCLQATTGGAVRPFDEMRDGLLLGEGAAAIVVESRAHAERRGATALAQVAGVGLAGDATHMTAPDRHGGGAARAMRQSMSAADVTAADIDFVSTHGTGTVYNDAMEMAALRTVLGERSRSVPANSIKGAIGHTLGAAGCFEAIMSVRAIAEDTIPPTAGCQRPDPNCELDVVVGTARHTTVRTVLSTSSAFAGNNAALILREA